MKLLLIYCLLLSFFIINLTLAENNSNNENNVNNNLNVQLPPAWRKESAGINAVYALINRTLGDGFQKDFLLRIQPNSKDNGVTDYFTVGSISNIVMLTANNQLNLAQALNYYLKYTGFCSFTWTGSQCQLKPGRLPLPTRVSVEIPHKYRYYLNHCTFGYSTVWWDWERWEREIDWMALNGFNLPLALVGQEYVWQKLMLSLGLQQSEIDSWFTGPAFLPWNRMGNLDGWGGVLPQNWIDGQYQLQIKILKRMKEYGMSPVFQGFAGHVPTSLKYYYPKASIVELPTWHGFSNTNHLLTIDPLYDTIASRYYSILNTTYGEYSDIDYISIDPFNELIPPSNSSQFLQEYTQSIFLSMNKFKSTSTWVLQSWFLNNRFWDYDSAEAFFSGIPIGRLIVLDLYSEVAPLWNQTDSYYGHNWIWNMLHNFGGRPGMFGRVQMISSAPFQAKSLSPSLVGVGLTPEAIEQNVMVYDLMCEMGWRSKPFDLNLWIDYYIARRYGNQLPEVSPHWKMMLYTIYNSKVKSTPNFISHKPSLSTKFGFGYDPDLITDAWRSMLAINDSYIKSTETYKFDITEITMEVLNNFFIKNVMDVKDSFFQSNKDNFEIAVHNCIYSIRAMDAVASTQKLYLLGKWTDDARRWATNVAEGDLYEFNARNLVTQWGYEGVGNPDYANKWWSGLLEDYYLPRWTLFFDHLRQALFDKSLYDEYLISLVVSKHEEKWNNQKYVYPSKPITTNNANHDSYFVSKLIYKQLITN